MVGEGVILGRSEASTRESHDEKTLVFEMAGSSPTMTFYDQRKTTLTTS
jgi:hypothetical protein